jgi:hypothetical protein
MVNAVYFKGDKRKMTKEEYGDFVLRYKGCGACFPMYHTLSRFEKMWFTAIQKDVSDLEKENAELRNVAEFQQSSNMNTHLENKKLKEGLTVGSMWNKHLNSQNKALEEERDRYRNMTFDQREQLTTAKEIIKLLLWDIRNRSYEPVKDLERAEQFLSEVEK